MEIIKDFLTLFLQLTAVLVLVFTAWPIRKPKLQLATAISVLNLDWALRSKTYSGLGECECLSDIVKEIIKEKTDKHDRVILGYRDPIRGLDVIKELSEWESTQYSYGPVLYLQENDERRWKSILESEKYSLGINISKEYHFEIAPEYKRGPLDRLLEIIKRKYGYDLGDSFDPKEKSDVFRNYVYREEEYDFLARIVKRIEEKCPNDMEKAIAISRLRNAHKVINIIQLKNPYHASINNIHLFITNAYRGTMKLVTEFSEKQGFSALVNTTQDVHLILGELPPNSERYCILETRLRPLIENDIKMQSNLLLEKLSPKILRFIIIGAAVVAIFAALNKHADAEIINNVGLFFQTLLSTKS